MRCDADVKFCNKFFNKSKVLKKYADINNIRNNNKGVAIMYMWPGCYSFKEELALFAQWLKQEAETIVMKIYELDRMLNG